MLFAKISPNQFKSSLMRLNEQIQKKKKDWDKNITSFIKFYLFSHFVMVLILNDSFVGL
jgi:hypothetical protein